MKFSEARGSSLGLAAVTVLLACLLGARPAECGGKRVLKPNVGGPGQTVDIVVYFTYDPLVTFQRTTDEEVRLWEPTFDRFSELLANATDGRLRLGERRFTFDISESVQADIWIHPTVQDETADPGGVNNINQHIYLYQQNQCTGQNPNLAVCARDPRVHGQYGILHEAGHYYWTLYEEYDGVCMMRDAANRLEATCAAGVTEPFYFCGSTVTSSACCVMDYNARDANRNRRSEFCISGGNVPEFQHQGTYRDVQGRCVTNLQENIAGMSCWDRIATAPDESMRLARIPQGSSPVKEGTTNLGGTGTTVVVDGKPGFVLVLDNSASMGQRDLSNDNFSRQELAQFGAINALDTMRADETVGVISFNSLSMTLLQPGRANVGDNRVAARDIIGNMPPPADWTNMGGALQAAFDALKALEPTPQNPLGVGEKRIAQKSIILLSDGRHTLGTDPGTVLPDVNETSEIVVHTIAFGPDSDVAGLQAIAQRTGGSFFFAEDAADQNDERGRLAMIFPKILAAARGETVAAEKTGTVPKGRAQAVSAPGARAPAAPGEPNRVTVPILIDSFTGSATFLLSYAPESVSDKPPHLELRTPSGARIFTMDPGNKSADGDDACWTSPDGTMTTCGAGLRYVRNEAQRLYRVPTQFIEPGTWELEVITTREATDPVAADDFTVLVLTEQRAVAVTAEVLNEPPVVFPDPIHLQTTVVAGFRVAGAEVTARVLLPAGGVSNVILYDDGLPEHGDAREDDGIYSVMFYDYKSAGQGGGDGAYVFKIQVNNVDGFEANSVDRDPNAAHVSISPFTAQTETCAFVTQVPSNVAAATGAMEAAAVGSPTPAPLPNPSILSMSVGNWQMTPIMQFGLTTENEYVKLKSFTLTSTGTGDESTLGQLSLFLDANKDGLPDNPTRPLARSVFLQDDDPFGAVFTTAGPMAALPPGTTNFIITAGPMRPPFRPEAPTLRPVAAAIPIPPILFWTTLLGALAVFFWVALRNLRFSQPARLVATSACLMFALVITGAIGCGSGGGPPDDGGGLEENPPKPGTYNMSVSPDAVVAVGATTRILVDVLGTSVESDVTYTPQLEE